MVFVVSSVLQRLVRLLATQGVGVCKRNASAGGVATGTGC